MVKEIGSFEMINETTDSITTSKYKVIHKTSKYPNSIWNYYGIAEKVQETSLPDIEKLNAFKDDRILCFSCFHKGTIQLYKKTTSSGNLWRHLNRIHEIVIPKSIKTIVKIRSSITSDGLMSGGEYSDNHNLYENEGDFCTVTSVTDDEQINDYLKPEKSKFKKKDIGSLLIEEISKRPYLYEFSNGRATDKKAIRDKLWNEIYEHLDKILDVKRLQQMWKNIRDRYRKIRSNDKQGDPPTKYKYYHQLHFLDGEHLYKQEVLDPEIELIDFTMENVEPIHLKKKLKIDDLDEEYSEKNDHEYNVMEMEIPFADIANTHDLDDSIHSSSSVTNNCIKNENNYMYECLVSSQKTTGDIDDFKIITMTDDSLLSDKVNVNENDNEKSNDRIDDELDFFGRFIAEKMRNLPKSNWNNLQIKILQVLKNEEQ